jgi:prepilin-type N-terminal cleavage/methylation domain-containing protein/prepilin-type processing-associated H-X9-DG protein
VASIIARSRNHSFILCREVIMNRRRQGFTLIELLVVMAIIAILIGLLLPAVQKVREAAARAKCTNNLKQIGTALHNYHGVYNAFPPGSNTLGYTVVAQILPFIEQDNLYKQLSLTLAATDASNNGPKGTTIRTLICPSDVIDVPPAGLGGNNYFANYGSEPWFFQNSSIANGVFALREQSGIPVTGIPDGSSNTVAFSELAKGDFNNAISTPRADWYNATALGAPTTADDANNLCLGIDTTNLSYQWLSGGNEWLNDNGNGTAYTHVGRPNTRSCGFPGNLRFSVNASSYHTGGVNALLCDGSCRFVANSIDLATWRAAGTRAGGETLPLP